MRGLLTGVLAAWYLRLASADGALREEARLTAKLLGVATPADVQGGGGVLAEEARRGSVGRGAELETVRPVGVHVFLAVLGTVRFEQRLRCSCSA